MNAFAHNLELCTPLFLLVFIGWALIKTGIFDKAVSTAVSKFVFRFLMPVLLFSLMSKVRDMPPVNWNVLVAFFGSCTVVFIMGKVLGRMLFGQDSTGQVITGMGGIFGNNVQLGVPIVQVSLGASAIPTISLLIIFNVLLLWTTATACVEFGRTGGRIDAGKFLRALYNIFRNPIVLGILIGTGWSFTGLALPGVVDATVQRVATATTPCALIAVGMGLAQHSFRAALPKASVITLLKLIVQPALVFLFCRLLGIGALETNAATVLACLPVAINLYIMACEFDSEGGAASNAIFLSTLLGAVTVPVALALLNVGY